MHGYPCRRTQLCQPPRHARLRLHVDFVNSPTRNPRHLSRHHTPRRHHRLQSITTASIKPEGQFKGVHYFNSRASGCPRRPLQHSPPRNGLLAPKARKCRLLPIEYALWKNRGLGKGRLQSPESPACAYSSRITVFCGCGGGNSVYLRLRLHLTWISHQSQGCSEAWVGGISSVLITGHDEGQVLIRCLPFVLLPLTDRS